LMLKRHTKLLLGASKTSRFERESCVSQSHLLCDTLAT
jgi:hypothetical protein